MKYVASVSFGKDSLAQLIKIKELGLPLDEVIYVYIKFSDAIDGGYPLMNEWIPEAEKILYEDFGIEITHLSGKSFVEQFFTRKRRGKNAGKIYGFPLTMGAWCNRTLKMDVINQYIRDIDEGITMYVGIAYDEPNRVEGLLKKSNKKITYKSVLHDEKITELEAFAICKAHGLLSPIYTNGKLFRDGCWFCVKQPHYSLFYLYSNYPDYWNELLELEQEHEKVYYYTSLANSTFRQLNDRFENGYIPKPSKKLPDWIRGDVC